MPDGQYTEFPIDYENISAVKVPYDNTDSGLTATNVQDALDEVAQGGGGGGGDVTSVNGKTGIVVLNASDVGAVPTTRTVNSQALSSDISLTASDVGALSSSTTAADIGAIVAPSSPTSGQFLSWNGSAWVAADLPVYTGGVS